MSGCTDPPQWDLTFSGTRPVWPSGARQRLLLWWRTAFSEAGDWALAGAAWSDSATPVTVGVLKILRDAGVTVRPQRTISADSCRGIPRATRLGIYKAELIRPKGPCPEQVKLVTP